jgi:multidrug efflux pump subunit AcrA (membrane-fusion protein)
MVRPVVLEVVVKTPDKAGSSWFAWRAAAAALASILALHFNAVSAEPYAIGTPDLAVTTIAAKRICFTDTLQATGVLVPRSEILVRPEREGLQISQVLVEVGDTVGLRQVMARLTPQEGQPGNATAVQAPAAGIVTSRNAVVGAMASAQGEPLFRIAVQGEMELEVEMPVASMAKLSQNQSARVEILGVGELPGKMRIASVATQLGQVRLFIGKDQRLRAGAFGRANIETGKRCSPAVPLSAVLYGSGGAVVQVVRDNRIETRSVRVGLFAGGQAEIREGLAEGDLVVARAGAFVRDGDRVRAMTGRESPVR